MQGDWLKDGACVRGRVVNVPLMVAAAFEAIHVDFLAVAVFDEGSVKTIIRAEPLLAGLAALRRIVLSVMQLHVALRRLINDKEDKAGAGCLEHTKSSDKSCASTTIIGRSDCSDAYHVYGAQGTQLRLSNNGVIHWFVPRLPIVNHHECADVSCHSTPSDGDCLPGAPTNDELVVVILWPKI